MKDMLIGVGRYAMKYRGTLVFLFLGLLFESIYDVFVRFSLKFVVDTAILGKDFAALTTILILLGVGAVLFNCIVIGCDYVWARIGGRILNDIRRDMFARLQDLPLEYHKRRATGDLVARFNADMAQIENGIVLALPMATMGLIEVLISLGVMFFLNPLLCLISAVGIVASLMIPRFIQGRALDASFLLRREEGGMAGFLQENLSGQPLVKAYRLEKHTSAAFGAKLDVLLARLTRANFLSYLVSRLPNLCFLIVQLTVLAVASWLAMQGAITIGDVVAYQALLIGLNSAIFNLTWMLPSFIDATSGWRRIREILDEPLGPTAAPASKTLPEKPLDVSFKEISFAYPGATQPALRGVTLNIVAGEHVAFVGRSGAGKSSLMNLLMRFYDVDAGAVRIGGTDVREVSLDALRARIGLVSQDVFLFDLSVRDNIRLGRLSATDEEVEAAAKAADIHERITALEHGYETMAGPNGSLFSGGERQRIALARALVRQPSILILDEFSSALDAGTEAAILRTIDALRGRCTIISIAHRLAVARSADRIYVMGEGSVVEAGTHNRLVAANGPYAELWRTAGGEDRARAEGDEPEPEADATLSATETK
jgi:ATP-binding cassette subfamily B protein